MGFDRQQYVERATRYVESVLAQPSLLGGLKVDIAVTGYYRVALRQQSQAGAPATKPRRRMSATARKNISDAMKRRHAERKAAAGSKK